MTPDKAREENAYSLGVQAYLWGLPLTEWGKTTLGGVKAGAVHIGDFRKHTELKTAKDRFVVTPNNVTLDGYGVFDVRREPAVVFVPRLTTDRWYIVQLGDLFDEIFHNIGGIKGPQPGVYVITGPDFQGPVPGDMTRLASRSRIGTAALRVFVSGQDDVPAAIQAQSGFRLMPLSAYLSQGLAYHPAEQVALEPPPQNAPEGLRFYEALGHWMKLGLPSFADTADTLVRAFHRIGLSVAHGFDWQGLDEPTKAGLARAAPVADAIVDDAWKASGETTNGWRYTFANGRAGHDLALRAALAKGVIGAQLSDQVIYPNCLVDSDGRALDGANAYVMRFNKGQTPPVSVFWNLNMFGPDMFFVENDLHRYSIGSTTDGLKPDSDGSLSIFIQAERPSDEKVSNWLPAPRGSFNLTMRMYGPQTPVLDGSYRLPPVTRAH